MLSEISSDTNTNTYDKHKEYRKIWNSQNKDKLCQYQRTQYIKKINTDPEYRQTLNQKVKQRNEKIKLLEKSCENETVKPKRGRPRTKPIMAKKANGRPRIY